MRLSALSVLAAALSVVAVAGGNKHKGSRKKLQDDPAGAAAARGWGWYPAATSAPPASILRNDTLYITLSSLAKADETGSSRGTVLFTTVRFGKGAPEGVLGQASTFCHWLHEAGLLQHTLVITTDEATWEALEERGLPVFLDRAFPRREAYVRAMRPKGEANREVDVQKLWWGWKLAGEGYRVVYLDIDSVVLSAEVLAPLAEPFDVQGLSAWSEVELGEVGAAAQRSCGLYAWVQDSRMPAGVILQESAHIADGVSQTPSVTPCQSTGLWLLQPTPAAVRFMRALVQRTACDAVWQRHGAAWNELIVPFLWGMGGQPPLRYRLLPVTQYLTVPVYRLRQAEQLPTDPVALHAGPLHGAEKREQLEQLQLYRTEFRLQANGTAANESEGDGSSNGSSRGSVGVGRRTASEVVRRPMLTIHPRALAGQGLMFWAPVALMMAGTFSGGAVIVLWQLVSGRGTSSFSSSRRRSLSGGGSRDRPGHRRSGSVHYTPKQHHQHQQQHGAQQQQQQHGGQPPQHPPQQQEDLDTLHPSPSRPVQPPGP